MNVRFDDAAQSGVYRAASAGATLGAARACGLRVAHLRLEAGTDKPRLLDMFAQALEFPRWFGRNWDALQDCLTDLSWLSGRGQLILIENAPRLPEQDLQVLSDILASAASFWAARGKPFFAVLVGGPDRLPDIEGSAPP